VPPLRERKQDIPPLVTFFVKQFAQQLGKSEPEISPEAFQTLRDYSWPGNVRELQNAMENAVVLARQNTGWSERIARRIAIAGRVATNRAQRRFARRAKSGRNGATNDSAGVGAMSREHAIKL
jgi:DNA-binding NtrC family response regulator